MACVAVTSLVRTIELEFLQSQLRPITQGNELISCNKELINSLLEKLEFLMEQFDEKRMDGVEAIKCLETKLRNVAFRVEDEIEFHVADLYVDKVQFCLKLNQTFCHAIGKPHPSLKLHHILQQAIEDIDEIKEDLVKVKNKDERVIDLQGTNTTVGVLPKSDEVIMMGDSSQHASHLEDIMVGKNDMFQTIKELLIGHPSKQREVVSIKGMGGIGKTTLARRVYEDPPITSHFDKQAWVVSSQHNNKRQMLIGLLNSMGNEQSGSDEELALQLYQSFKGQRFLVVMDDVWSREAWDAMKACFPDDKNGSRVLLTTRLAEVANYTCSSKYFSQHMHLLDQSESWNLFCEKVFLKGAEFETVGRPIVEKCNGLPLAIVVAAGLFSKLNTLDEWKNIAKALNPSAITTIAEACSRILSLSYNHLPYNLKACFLYLGVFPEDEEINANNLARLWAAEGLVKAFENESCEQVAKRQIEELKDRNLILVRKQSSSGRKIKTVWIHDLLHAFCVREALNENLLNVVGNDGSNFHKKDFRWLSIQSSSFDFQTFYSSSKNCRSIFYFPKSVAPYLNLQNFNILRVLYSTDIKYPAGHKFCKIVRPIHLRYLSSSIVEIFGSEPSSLWNLQTLCARGRTLSYSLDFPQLCYCYRDWAYYANPPYFVHQNLQSISGLSLSHCTEKLFTSIPYLKRVCITKTYESTVECVNCIGNLVYLQQLESLKIYVYYYAFKYPINNQIALLKNLKRLSFFGTVFRWEEINVLSKLPRLEVLKLGHYACRGQKWKLREDEKFCQLIFLKFDGLGLKHWEVSDDHFPELERLLLINCKLKEIPSSFADISTLKSIELRRCLLSAVTSAKQIQQAQHVQGNHNMVVIERYTIQPGEINLTNLSSARGAEEEMLEKTNSGIAN